MKFNLKHFSFLLMVAGMILAGCSKDSTTPEGEKETAASSDYSFKNFSFKKEANPTLDMKYTSRSGGNLIYITVPDGIALNSLKPSFTVHEKAVVKIGSTVIKSDETVVDFSKTQTITVTAEDGKSASYQVLVKNGNSKIDNMVYDFMLDHDLPGVSVAISKDEKTVYATGYGFSDKEAKVRADENTLFRLASMSKQHAAIAIMKLYERGMLDIDDTVFGKGGLLEEMFGDEMGEKWKRITVRDILSHSSGISTDCIFGSSTYSGLSAEGRVRLLLQDASNMGYGIGRFSYNNSNFGIAGLIVEHLTGKEFMQFLKEEVYSPIGIEDIYGGMNTQAEKRSKECVYYGQGGKNPYGNDVEAGVAAGGVIASTSALMKLMAHLDYAPGVPDIFPKEILDLMYTAKEGMYQSNGSVWNRYGLGWRVNYPSISSWASYHGGTLAGVCTIWARGKNNVNGVVLCNSRSYDKGIDDEMWYMLRDIQALF